MVCVKLAEQGNGIHRMVGVEEHLDACHLLVTQSRLSLAPLFRCFIGPLDGPVPFRVDPP